MPTGNRSTDRHINVFGGRLIVSCNTSFGGSHDCSRRDHSELLMSCSKPCNYATNIQAWALISTVNSLTTPYIQTTIYHSYYSPFKGTMDKRIQYY